MSRSHDRAAFTAPLFALVLVSLAGCDTNYTDPTRFGALRLGAPVAILPSPGPGPLGGRYGEHVVGINTFIPYGPSPGVFLPASRIGVSGGESSAFFLFSGFDDGVRVGSSTTMGPHPTMPTRLIDGCTDLVYCGAGSGRSITPLPSWSYEGIEVHGCIASSAGLYTQRPLPPNEMLQVRCETLPNTIGFVDVPDGIELGASSAPLPITSTNGCPPTPHPVGAAVFGAPRDAGGSGGVYLLQPPPFANLERIDLGFTLPAGAGLGTSLAASASADGSILVASGTTGTMRRVVVFSLHSEAGIPSAFVHACLSGQGPGFGHALVFGDLDRDGTDELIVGGADVSPGAATAVTADPPVSIWDTGSLLALAGAGCDAAAPAPPPDFELLCPQGVRGLTCGTAMAPGNSGFGTSVAVGDIDADGDDDLVVGAPLTAASTGAVVVFPGSGSLASLGTGVGWVASTTMRTGSLLGYSVATLHGTDRDEIIASSPGVGEVAVFLCTELTGDTAREAAMVRDGVYRVCARHVAGVPVPMCGGRADAGPTGDGGMLTDAGDVDAGDLDAGDLDAGDVDAGDVDAGDVDAGDVDAGALRVDAP